jgi:hypothetical protein
MNITNFLEEKNNNVGVRENGLASSMRSQLQAKWMIIIFDLLWAGSLPVWAMYLFGIGFMDSARLGWFAYAILISYFSFPVAVIYTLSGSVQHYKRGQYERGARLSCLPFLWILSYFLIAALTAFSK